MTVPFPNLPQLAVRLMIRGLCGTLGSDGKDSDARSSGADSGSPSRASGLRCKRGAGPGESARSWASSGLQRVAGNYPSHSGGS